MGNPSMATCIKLRPMRTRQLSLVGLTALGELPIEYRWSIRYNSLESWVALSNIEHFQEKMEAAGHPIFAQIFNLRTDYINEDPPPMVIHASSVSRPSQPAWCHPP